MKQYRPTGSFVSTRECVNLVTHTNFTVLMCYRSRLLINKLNARASGYEMERRFTKFVEITQCNGNYAVKGHSRSSILVPIERSYTTSYYWLLTYPYLAPFPSYGQFSLARGECLTLTLSLGVIPCYIAKVYTPLKPTLFGLHFRCRKYRCIFNHFYVR